MVSERERDLIEQKMKEAGIQNMRAYLLKMAIDGYIIHLDVSEVQRVLTLLNNATNNINQIARRVNSTGSIYKNDIRDLQEQVGRLWEKVGGMVESLSEV